MYILLLTQRIGALIKNCDQPPPIIYIQVYIADTALLVGVANNAKSKKDLPLIVQNRFLRQTGNRVEGVEDMELHPLPRPLGTQCWCCRKGAVLFL